MAQDGIIQLVVDDDGRGIDSEGRAGRESGHVGLDLLGELAAEHHGSLNLGPSPSGGARLILEVPER